MQISTFFCLKIKKFNVIVNILNKISIKFNYLRKNPFFYINFHGFSVFCFEKNKPRISVALKLGSCHKLRH